MLGGCDKQSSLVKPPAAPGSGASGEYRTSFSSFHAPPDSLKKLAVDGPFYINHVFVIEESIGVEMALVNFLNGELTGSDTNERDHSTYRINIHQNSAGEATSIELFSNAANDFAVTVYIHQIENDLPAYSFTMRSDDGVHGPGGAVIPDPYNDPDLPIAGDKQLNFKGSRDEGIKIQEVLDGMGYETFSSTYGDGVYAFSALQELDSRAKIEEIAMKPKNWTVVDEKTKGNVGFYSKAGDFSGTIIIDWTFNEIPFTIEIKDAKLVMLEDGIDETNYTFSGTAEIKQKSFQFGEMVYQLKDNPKKPFSVEYGFKVLKEPSPAVVWDYVESWEYVDEAYGTSLILPISYMTRNGPAEMSSIPVKSLTEIDGTDTMSFMLPAYGGTATWTFKKD